MIQKQQGMPEHHPVALGIFGMLIYFFKIF